MAQKISPAVVEEIKALHASGLTFKKIAEITQRNYATVRRYLDEEYRKRDNARTTRFGVGSRR